MEQANPKLWGRLEGYEVDSTLSQLKFLSMDLHLRCWAGEKVMVKAGTRNLCLETVALIAPNKHDDIILHTEKPEIEASEELTNLATHSLRRAACVQHQCGWCISRQRPKNSKAWQALP